MCKAMGPTLVSRISVLSSFPKGTPLALAASLHDTTSSSSRFTPITTLNLNSANILTEILSLANLPKPQKAFPIP
jgi:hypothetical protein